MDILLAGGPDAGVELSEEEPVVPGLPAVHHFVRVRLVDSVIDALVSPQLAALRLGDPLRPDAPVRGNEGGDGEKQREKVQADREQGPAPPIGLHGPPKFMGGSWRRCSVPGYLQNAPGEGEVQVPSGAAQDAHMTSDAQISDNIPALSSGLTAPSIHSSLSPTPLFHTRCPTSPRPIGRHVVKGFDVAFASNVLLSNGC